MSERRPILPTTYLVIAVGVMFGLYFLLPGPRVLFPPYSHLGGLLIVLGVALNIAASNVLTRAQTAVQSLDTPPEESSQLLEGSLFRLSRNPIYLGMVLFLVGVAGMLGTVTPFVVIPAFVWLIQSRFVIGEEATLEQRFGDTYRDYKRRVRRWL
jgi:protein-S-isoprenylcysteine O-methyltransferase Ste14